MLFCSNVNHAHRKGDHPGGHALTRGVRYSPGDSVCRPGSCSCRVGGSSDGHRQGPRLQDISRPSVTGSCICGLRHVFMPLGTHAIATVLLYTVL